MTSSSPVWRFTRGFVYARNSVYIIAYLPELEREKIYASQVFSWTGEWSAFQVAWPVSCLCLVDVPEPNLLCVGAAGQVQSAVQSGFSEEAIDDGPEGPAYRGDIRDVRLIGEHVYAVGMGRQVYRRGASGKWVRIDSGVVIPIAEARVAGFNSIHGLDENNIFAVGWEGEIWLYNGQEWEMQDSPSNVKLEHVLCVSPSTVYACGQAGTLLEGIDGKWKVVSQDSTDEQFWSLEWFQNKLWLATQKGLWCREDDGALSKVDFGLEDQTVTSGWLQAADGVMWSVGDQHLFSTEDGVSWNLHVIPES